MDISVSSVITSQAKLPVNQASCMRNWLTIQEKLKDLKSTKIIRQMLAYEIDHKARPDIINRLLSRYLKLLKGELLEDIRCYIKEAEQADKRV